VTLAVDQASKQWALDDLGDGRTVRVLGRFLTFTLHFNPGAAFSFGTGATWVFTAVSCAVVLALPFVIARSRSAPWAIALGVVWGGAAGNFADRLVREPGVGRGHVVDFIGYSDWFVGNVADIALVGGILALLAISFFDGGDGSGERVKACIVVRPGEKLTVEALQKYAAANLTGYKRPKAYEFFDSLPKSNVGKILKRELLAREKAKAGGKA